MTGHANIVLLPLIFRDMKTPHHKQKIQRLSGSGSTKNVVIYVEYL